MGDAAHDEQSSDGQAEDKGRASNLDLPTIFERALSLSDAPRLAYLSEVCAGNEDLRREIESLLEAADPSRDDDHFSEPDPIPGRKIAGFTVVRLLGAGGHGRVYLARQQSPERDVALKIMAGGLLSRSARRRFEYESELLARLRHPGIAHVYEAGVETIGGVPLPWFAMEHIDGARTIVEYVRDTQLAIPDRVRLAVELCEVLQYGHQNGVLHRDLKPSNILVGSDGRPKIIDFGVAGSLGGDRLPLTLATQAGDMLGTLAYMSPEQCGGDARTADARADTYALGAVLYEILTLEPAFDLRSKALPDAIQTVVAGVPRLPSMLEPALRGDLEAIVMKALERDPARRYQSAAAFAQDLQAFLEGAPVRARKQTIFYRSERFLRRHWLPVAIAGTVLSLLLTATFISLSALEKERRARIAEEERSRELAAAVEKAAAEERVRRAVIDFLSKQVVGAAPTRARKPDVTVRESLLAATARISEITNGDARAEVELRRQAAVALQGMNEFKAACDEYARVIELVDGSASTAEPLLDPRVFVEVVGAYGLVLSALNDPRGMEIQERSYRDGQAVLGAQHPLTIQAGMRLLSGRIKRDGFSAVRGDAERLYDNAVAGLGVDDLRAQGLRAMLIRGLSSGDAADRARAVGLMQTEMESALRIGNGKASDTARALQLEFLVALGDVAAVELGRSLVADTAAVFAPATPAALTRRGMFLRALRHHGFWSEAIAVARTQLEGHLGAETSSAADRMDAWLDLAVVAAEASEREVAEEALVGAASERSKVPAESTRPQVARLDEQRVRALLGRESSQAQAADDAQSLRRAIDAVTGTRPWTIAAKREAGAILARLLARAGQREAAHAAAREYLDACAAAGLAAGALAREMQQLLGDAGTNTVQ